MKRKNKAISYVILSAAALLLICGTGWAKDYTRSCSALYVVKPTSIPGGGTTAFSPVFTGKGKVGYYNPNEARRRARKNLLECIRTHWSHRNPLTMPSQCRESNRVYNYPYSGLAASLGYLVCRRNPGQSQITARVEVTFRGDKGCLDERRGLDPTGMTLDDNFRFVCPTDDDDLH
jgi:hypothetical protein